MQIPTPPSYSTTRDWAATNDWMFRHLPTWAMVEQFSRLEGADDLERARTMAYAMAYNYIELFNDLLARMEAFPKPIVAAETSRHFRAISQLRVCLDDAKRNRETTRGGASDEMWDGFLQGIQHAILTLQMTQKPTTPKP